MITVVSYDFFYFESAKWIALKLLPIMGRNEEYCFFFDNSVELDSEEVIVFRLPFSSDVFDEKMNVSLEGYEQHITFKANGVLVTTYKRKAE